MQPKFRVGPSSLVKAFWKHLYKHLQRYIFMVILDQSKLTMKADCYINSENIN